MSKNHQELANLQVFENKLFDVLFKVFYMQFQDPRELELYLHMMATNPNVRMRINELKRVAGKLKTAVKESGIPNDITELKEGAKDTMKKAIETGVETAFIGVEAGISAFPPVAIPYTILKNAAKSSTKVSDTISSLSSVIEKVKDVVSTLSDVPELKEFISSIVSLMTTLQEVKRVQGIMNSPDRLIDQTVGKVGDAKDYIQKKVVETTNKAIDSAVDKTIGGVVDTSITR